MSPNVETLMDIDCPQLLGGHLIIVCSFALDSQDARRTKRFTSVVVSSDWFQVTCPLVKIKT